MSDNNFENKIQQKMDELRMPPSPQVWEQVERRIREKKRRRVLVFWFLLAGLLLTGGIIVYRQMNNDLPVQVMFNNATGNHENNSPEKNNLKENISSPTQTQSEKEKATGLNKTKAAENPEKITGIISAGINKNKTDIPARREEKGIKIVKKNELNTPKIKAELAVIAAVPAEQIKKNNDDLIVDKKINGSAKEKPAEHVPVMEDKTDLEKEVVEERKPEDVKPETKPDEPVAEKEEKPKKNKWEIGLNGGFGAARLTNGSIASFGAKSLSDAFAAPSSGTSTSSPPPVSFADSIPLKGLAWQLGVYVKHKLGKKTAISFGLNLSVYSAKQRIGVFFDSVITINNGLRTVTSDGVYNAGSYSSFRNKYYYVMVPVLLHWQLNKGDKLPPLIWENGLAPSFLAGSNALVYDKSSNLFYKDKRVYNSFNLVYQTGLSARLFKDKKHPLTAGVYYTYHISRLQKVTPPDYNYLSSYGLKLNRVIKK